MWCLYGYSLAIKVEDQELFTRASLRWLIGSFFKQKNVFVIEPSQSDKFSQLPLRWLPSIWDAPTVSSPVPALVLQKPPGFPPPPGMWRGCLPSALNAASTLSCQDALSFGDTRASLHLLCCVVKAMVKKLLKEKRCCLSASWGQ